MRGPPLCQASCHTGLPTALFPDAPLTLAPPSGPSEALSPRVRRRHRTRWREQVLASAHPFTRRSVPPSRLRSLFLPFTRRTSTSTDTSRMGGFVIAPSANTPVPYNHRGQLSQYALQCLGSCAACHHQTLSLPRYVLFRSGLGGLHDGHMYIHIRSDF